MQIGRGFMSGQEKRQALIAQLLIALASTYGDIVFFRRGFERFYLISNPDDITCGRRRALHLARAAAWKAGHHDPRSSFGARR